MTEKIRIWQDKDNTYLWHWYCHCCDYGEVFNPWCNRNTNQSDFWQVGRHIDKYHPRRSNGFINAFGHWKQVVWTKPFNQ